MKVRIKKLHQDAVIPKYAKEGDAGMDLVATEMNMVNSGRYQYVEYRTGLAIEIPEGYFGFLRPRSSVSKTTLIEATSGIIDSGYRGELSFRFKCSDGIIYGKGDRVCQLIILPYPTIEFEEADELTETERGSGGYGSTGN